jgi:cellulose synthase (UDP-forming)
VGFFQAPTVGLVQTPQSFYNADPIARNLGLEDILTPEEEVFYRQIQPIRDGAGSVVCSGTSFVVRRQALKDAGGFVTDSLSEDYFTGIRLSAQGYRLIYLDEKLSAGLAAETIADHASQRLRWARGTLQAFFIEANPLTIPGLSPLQRLAHLEGLLHWFTSFSRVGFLLFPLAYAFLGVIPLRATMDELMYFFLPYVVAQFATFAWLNGRSRSALLSDIYSLVLAFPLALTVLRVMLNPFGKGFNVTPKGVVRSRYRFNWSLAWPLIVMFVGTAFSLWRNLGICMIKADWQTTVPPEVAQTVKGVGLGWVWSAYNLMLIGIALLILLDVPKPDLYEWFNLRRTVQLTVGDRQYWGSTTMLSEGGAEIVLTQTGFEVSDSASVTLTILESDLTLDAQIVRAEEDDDGVPIIRVLFEPLNLAQEQALVEMLFCRPGQWQSRTTPGEVHSIWILLRTLLKPRVLFERNVEVRAISLTQG